MYHSVNARKCTARDQTKIKLLSINIHRKNKPTCNTVTVAHIYASLDGVKIKRTVSSIINGGGFVVVVRQLRIPSYVAMSCVHRRMCSSGPACKAEQKNGLNFRCIPRLHLEIGSALSFLFLSLL